MAAAPSPVFANPPVDKPRSLDKSPSPYPPAPGVPGSKKHRFKARSADDEGPLFTARTTTRAAAEQLPQSNPRTNGIWTELGPAPIQGEKYCCTTGPPPQPISSFGPVTGRITSMDLVPGVGAQPVFLGTAGGGVWKGDYQHSIWTALTDAQASLAIGAIAVDSTGQRIYAGTGEDNLSDSQPGQGILKSTDGGVTWTTVGQSTFGGHHIGSIAIDRRTSNPQTVYVASDVGLYVSTDSGSTWSKMFIPSPRGIQGRGTPSGAATLVIEDPSAPQRFWVSVSDFCQTEAGDVYLFDTQTGWSRVTPPAFQTNSIVSSRIGIGVGPGGVAYLAAADCAGRLIDLERGTGYGGAWSGPLHTAGTFDYFNYGVGQGDYDNVIAVDPTNANVAIFGGVTVLVTTNGGASFQNIGQVYDGGVIHPDIHAAAFATGDGHRLLMGTDGGLWSSLNLGGTNHAPPFGTSGDWQDVNGNLATVQFYKGTALDSSHFLGGTQDNGTAGRLAGLAGSIPTWQSYFGGDGGNSAIDPGSSTVYVETPGLAIASGDSTVVPGDPASPDDSFVDAAPCFNPSDPACSDPVSFVAPFVMDPSNALRLFGGTNRVWRSTSGGVPAGPSGWSAISGDLTFAKTISPFTDRLQEIVTGPANANVVMTASLLGRVYISTNATAVTPSWTEMTGNLPAFNLANVVEPNGWIGGIAFNPGNSSEAWAVMGGVNVGHVWHTTTAGASWSDLSGSGSSGVPNAGVNGIALDPVDPNTVYIATDSTVMVCTTCAGATPTPNWAVVGSGLPNAKASGLTFSRDGATLFAWTHGRGAWSMPRLTALAAPRTLQFATATSGVNPPSQTVMVSSPAATSFTLGTPAPPAWLNVSPGNVSTTPGSPGQFAVSVSTAGLVGGTYAGSFTLVPGNGAPAITVAVTLEVARFPGAYRPVVPFRVLDTRSNIGHSGSLGPAQKISVPIAGVAGSGVPSMGSSTPPSAVVLNVTATNPTLPSYLTVYPGPYLTCGGAPSCVNPGGTPNPPLASNLNFIPGQSVPNLVEVAVGDDGTVGLFNAQGNVDVIFDVQGWVTRQGAANPTPGAGLFRPLVPARIMDTRTGTGGRLGAVHSGEAVNLQVTGSQKEGGGLSGVPTAGVSAVVLNVTVTDPTASSSYLTLYPTDASSRPTASNLNFVGGQTVPNRVMVKLSGAGQVTIFNAAGNVHVVVDVAGWFTDGNINTTGAQFTGLSPARILDTRTGAGGIVGPVCGNQTIIVPVAGQGGVPALPTTQGAVMNVTATDTTAGSFLTVYPSDALRPTASDLNWVAGLTVPNLVVIKVSAADGKIAIYNAQGCVDVVADVVGWYG